MENLQNSLSLKKGWEFQKFVETALLPYPIYSVDHRTSYYEESPTLKDRLPDYIFRPNYAKKKRFAVECKYRSNLSVENDIVKPHILKRYFEYKEKEGIPVFIVLGVGNLPSNPDSLYIFPLENGAVFSMMYKDHIQKFERTNKGVLVFDEDKLI